MNFAISEIELDELLLARIEHCERWKGVVGLFGNLRFVSRTAGANVDALYRRVFCWLKLCEGINTQGCSLLREKDHCSKDELRFFQVIVEKTLEEGETLIGLLWGARMRRIGGHSIDTIEAVLFRLRITQVMWHAGEVDEDVRARVLRVAFGRGTAGIGSHAGELFRMVYQVQRTPTSELLESVSELRIKLYQLAARVGMGPWDFLKVFNPDILEYGRLHFGGGLVEHDDVSTEM